MSNILNPVLRPEHVAQLRGVTMHQSASSQPVNAAAAMRRIANAPMASDKHRPVSTLTDAEITRILRAIFGK